MFYDQDVLNLLAGRDQIDLSLRWNFPVFFDNSGLSTTIDPLVRHYMSRPRPWDGPFRPWGRNGMDQYIRLVERHPELKVLFKPFRGVKFLRYSLQQNYKRITDGKVWNTAKVRAAIAEYERQAAL